MKNRSFKVLSAQKTDGIGINSKNGRYISSTPMAAAKKAFTKMCNSRSRKELTITIQETTAQSARKSFMYHLSRVKLKKPIVRFPGTDKEFKIRYTVHCISVPSAPPRKDEKIQKGGSSGVYEISRTQYLVVSSLEEICNRLKLRRRKLLRTKVRGKARIVGKVGNQLRKMRLQKDKEKIRLRIADQGRRKAESSIGNQNVKKIQIGTGKSQGKSKHTNRYHPYQRLREQKEEEAMLQRPGRTGPGRVKKRVEDEIRKAENEHQKSTCFSDFTVRRDEEHIPAVVFDFLANCDLAHDFLKRGRSFITDIYHDTKCSDNARTGFEICKESISAQQICTDDCETIKFGNNFELYVFNFLYDKYPLISKIGDMNEYRKRFKFYCINTGAKTVERLFTRELAKGGPGRLVDVKTLFEGFHFYARDISATAKLLPMKRRNEEFQQMTMEDLGLKRVVSTMHYWDPGRTPPVTELVGTEKNTFINGKIVRGANNGKIVRGANNGAVDPRFTEFCILNKTDGNTSVILDVGCDGKRNNVNISNQMNYPINSVKNISYLIGLLLHYNPKDLFGIEQDVNFPLSLEDCEKAFEPNYRMEKMSSAMQRTLFRQNKYFEALKSNREKKFNNISNISKSRTSLRQLYDNLKTLYHDKFLGSDHIFYNKDEFKENAIQLLFDMKRTGDWGQASWVYHTNLKNQEEAYKKNSSDLKRVIFESGDRLAALYSIYINNPTLFGGKDVGAMDSSTFGIYNPLLIPCPNTNPNTNPRRANPSIKQSTKQIEQNELTLKMYAATESITNCMKYISSDVDQFLNQNIVHYTAVAYEIFSASSKALPNYLATKETTVSKQNEAIYNICIKWLQNEVVTEHPTNNLEMFELTDFILFGMTSILQKSILDESENVLTTTDKTCISAWRGWIEALYPNKFYILRGERHKKVQTFVQQHRNLLTQVWNSTYQWMYQCIYLDEVEENDDENE